MKNADLDVLEHCIEWLSAGHQVDLVTVARTWGSSPKPLGSLAAVRDDGVLVGSVSGGCIEKQLAESFKGQSLNRIHSYRIDDQQAKRFGLACGGELELVFESLSDVEALRTIVSKLNSRQRIARQVNIANSTSTIVEAKQNDSFAFDGTTLKKVFGPSWQILLIGAGQLSSYVAQFATASDFDVLVCDPRPEFLQAWKIDNTTMLDKQPHMAVIEDAADFNSAVLALTHDPNLDDMALIEALPLPCFYVGALGSKRNYQRRCERLSNLLSNAELERLHSPIGLPIGSRTSAEIAISIVAELIKTRAATSQ